MTGKRRVQAVLTGVACSVFFTTASSAVKRVVTCNPGSQVSLAVWVYFSDKSIESSDAEVVSPRALARRRAAGFSEADRTDHAIASRYLRGVEAAGGRLRHCFKWENAASFDLPAGALLQVKLLPFVKKTELVGNYRRTTAAPAAKRLRRMVLNAGSYGTAFEQLAMLALPQAHEYLWHLHPGDGPAKGVRIAFFDSGFRLDHRCFRHLHIRDAIKGTWDFIDRDSTVADPDSVAGSSAHPFSGNDVHGTEVLSLVAAYDPPHYCGSAWGADFLLARTEDTYFDSSTGLEHEAHVEEDNWAAAVVWAESLGVDIISSSLGYRYDFQDTIIIERENGMSDTVVDYQKNDLDGRTTIVSRAARGAAERGVLIVNAAGNEQNDGDTSLSAPADVEGVIAVGSVNGNGSLSPFSSLGPSADGRLKPDVVAPGQQIYLPDIRSPGSNAYTSTNSGTSFSTPFVTGVCALIRQSFPLITAQQVREKLYRSCRFLPGQTMADYRFGRGIPDALRSCMQWDDEVFLSAIDTGGKPLVNATIISSNSSVLGSTTEEGTAVFRLPGEKPAAVAIIHGERMREVTIDSTPCRKEVVPCSLVVLVRTERGKPIPFVTVWYRSDGVERTATGDSLGNAVITGFFPLPIVFTAAKTGYIRSDTIRAHLGEQRGMQTLYLRATRRPLFEVYPTVVRRSRGDRLMVRFAKEDDGTTTDRRVNVSVRTVNGALVWKRDTTTDGTTVTLQWNGICTGDKSRTAPGIYFLMLFCEEERHRAKFIIAE
ncbi:MAG: S8 family serine peptidase [Chitinispirillaceae bacterium]|nr:S8 family serine peptidase [Chitinispirillaceae bacterium]